MCLVIHGKPYHSVPEAASMIGVSRVTLWRAIKNGARYKGTKIEVLRDRVNGRYYVSADSVAQLALDGERFVPL